MIHFSPPIEGHSEMFLPIDDSVSRKTWRYAITPHVYPSEGLHGRRFYTDLKERRNMP
jgi:hypothetical protein